MAKRYAILGLAAPLLFTLCGIIIAVIIIATKPDDFVRALGGVFIIGCFGIISIFILPIIFGIISLTYYKKAKQEAVKFPDLFIQPNKKIKYASIMAIIFPPLLLIIPVVSLWIYVPFAIIQTNKDKALDNIAIENMHKSIKIVSVEYNKLLGCGIPQSEISNELEKVIPTATAHLKNPHDPASSACRFVSENFTYYESDTKESVASKAGYSDKVGEVIVVISGHLPNRPRYLGAAVHCKVMQNMGGKSTQEVSAVLN